MLTLRPSVRPSVCPSVRAPAADRSSVRSYERLDTDRAVRPAFVLHRRVRLPRVPVRSPQSRPAAGAAIRRVCLPRRVRCCAGDIA